MAAAFSGDFSDASVEASLTVLFSGICDGVADSISETLLLGCVEITSLGVGADDRDPVPTV